MFEIEDVDVFLGLDVGKSAHHGHGLAPAGKKVFDKLTARFPAVLVIVDQPASIGALLAHALDASSGYEVHHQLRDPPEGLRAPQTVRCPCCSGVSAGAPRPGVERRRDYEVASASVGGSRAARTAG